MRILFCNYEYPPLGGGGGVVMAALARQLARRHEVTVLTSRACGLASEDDDHGVRVLRVPVFFRRQLAVANFPSMLAYLPTGLRRGIGLHGTRGRRDSAFDVINTHFVVPTGPLGQILSRWHHLPNVLSVHGGDLFDPSKRSSPHRHAILRIAVGSMLRTADEVVGQSRDTVQHVRDIYRVHRHVGLIPLGIERPVAAQAPSRAMFGLPPNAFVMITIGRLVGRKATAQLVGVLADSRITEAHLLIVGDGPDAGAIRQQAAQRGVQDRVHLLGQISEDDKCAALSIADIFVSTSQHEGFGLVFLEAMAFGLPVICYDRGGQTDFLASGRSGQVVKLNDTAAFTRAVVALHVDSDLRRACAQHNRQRVESFFIDTCAARYENVFEAAIEKRMSSRRAAASPF